MRLLLDTHVVIWALGDPGRLSHETRVLLDAADSEPLFSPINLLEVAIKSEVGRKNFNIDPRLLHQELLDLGFRELPILSGHALAVADLPPIHKDPFDRLLVAQALAEGITLLTADATVARYPGSIRRA